MFNKEAMISAVEAMGFKYSGHFNDGGVVYSVPGHSVLIYERGMVHHKPNGQKKFYYSDASVARIRSALVKSLASYK